LFHGENTLLELNIHTGRFNDLTTAHVASNSSVKAEQDTGRLKRGSVKTEVTLTATESTDCNSGGAMEHWHKFGKVSHSSCWQQSGYQIEQF